MFLRKSVKINEYKYASMFFSILLLLACTSCKEKDSYTIGLNLNREYSKIKTIETMANCVGSDGKYISSMNSYSHGGFSFLQNYAYKYTSLKTEVSSDKIGNLLDEKGKVTDTLSKKIIEMLRSHEFCRMTTNPGHFFKNISFVKKKPNNTILYTAKDRLGQSVDRVFDSAKRILSRLGVQNLLDFIQTIEISFDKWSTSDSGPLVSFGKIVQVRSILFTSILQVSRLTVLTIF